MDSDQREKMEPKEEPKEETPRNSSSKGLTPTSMEERRALDDMDAENSMSKDRRDEHLSRTKSAVSIADTLSLPREIAFVSVICMANFMTQAALGQVLSIIHIIGDSFAITDPGVLSWLIAGYSLTVGTFILISGRLGDAFGHKRLLLIGFAWFSVWSMVCGLAVYSNHVLFVFARVLQGIGPAIALPNSLAILGVTYAPGKRKAMVFAIFGAMAPNGSIAGSLFAGIFGQLAWWPWAFWALAIVLAVITVLGYFAIPEPPKDALASMPLSQKIRELDLEGATVGITALILVNFAWNQAPIVGWDKAYIIVTLVLGIALMPVFFYIELRWAKHPLIPKECLTTTVGFVLACTACGWACFGIWAYYIWQYIEIIRGIGPILASAWISPVCVSGALAAIVTGWLLGKVRPGVVMCIALTFFTTGTIIIMTVPIHQTYWAQTFVGVSVIPWGMDMSFPAATLILSNAVKKEHQGIAASLVNTVVNYSISLGLGFAGTVEVNVNHGGRNKKDLLSGYRGAWYVGCGLAGLGLGISIVFLMRHILSDRRESSSNESESE
ncbi:major facilitator superfamily-domain-containing protein [Venturia nashicola]|uniref:Major facilitator superfamily-domain-containing protein n=1 Tax=Venturia nashicola TaxID=86259 RepID=A0A4Z1P7S5_9PEZI|nr:major facilitator superfamily-domain-containing protein [Venturia nashicola]